MSCKIIRDNKGGIVQVVTEKVNNLDGIQRIKNLDQPPTPLELLFNKFLSPEKAKLSAIVVNNMSANIINRLGIPQSEYEGKVGYTYSNEDITPEMLRSIAINFSNLNNFEEDGAEILFQPNDDYRAVKQNNPKIRNLNLSESNEDNWLAKYLHTGAKKNEVINLKTKEEVQKKLKEEFELYADRIKYTDEFVLTEIKEGFLDHMIEQSRTNQDMLAMWEHAKENSQEFIESKQKEQRQALLSTYNTLADNDHYPMSYKLMIMEAITKNYYTYDAITDKVKTSKVDKYSMRTAPVLNELILTKTQETSSQSSQKVMNDYFYESSSYKGEKINLSEYVKNIFHQTDRGVWYKFPMNSDSNHFMKMSALSAGTPGAWCTGNPSMAENYIKRNDIYIFYSNETHLPTLQISLGEKDEVGGLGEGQAIFSKDVQDLDALFKYSPEIKERATEIIAYNNYTKVLEKIKKVGIDGLTYEEKTTIHTSRPYYKDNSGEIYEAKKNLPKSFYGKYYNIDESSIILAKDFVVGEEGNEDKVILGDLIIEVPVASDKLLFKGVIGIADISFLNNETIDKKLFNFSTDKVAIYGVTKATTKLFDTSGGRVDLINLKTATTKLFDSAVRGVDLENLTTATTKLFDSAGENVILESLKTATSKLFDTAGRGVYLPRLVNTTTKLFDTSGGYTDLRNLKSTTTKLFDTAEGTVKLLNLESTTTKLFDTVGRNIELNNLENTTSKLFDSAGGNVQLESLERATTKLFDSVGGNVQLESLESTTTKLFDTAGGNVDLGVLKSTTSKLFDTAGKAVFLHNLKRATTKLFDTAGGSVDLLKLETATTKLFDTSGGSVHLYNLKSTTTKLFDSAKGSVDLDRLENTTSKLFDSAGGSVELSNLKNTTSKLFDTAEGRVDLNSLESTTTKLFDTAEGFVDLEKLETATTKLFDSAGGIVDLESLKSTTSKLFDTAGGNVQLENLKSTTTKLFDTAGGSVYLNKLENTTSKLFDTAGETVFLHNLKSTTTKLFDSAVELVDLGGLETATTKLFDTAGGNVDLEKLETATSKLFDTSGGSVYLQNLKSTTTKLFDSAEWNIVVSNNHTAHKEAFLKDDDGNYLTDSNGELIENPEVRGQKEFELFNESETLNQDNRAAIIKVGGASLTVFGKKSDVTSIIHEKTHEYEDVLTENEVRIVEEWSGHKKGTVEFSEAFAKGAERYIYEGNLADSSTEIGGIFQKFKEWFQQLIEDAIAYFGDINELNPDIKKIYHDMVVAQQPVQKTDGVDIMGAPEGVYLNIGLNVEKTDEIIPKEFVISKLPRGVEALEYDENIIVSEGGTENTLLLKVNRKLSDPEMKKLLIDTQQLAIPVLANGRGTMYGTLDWGEFNPEFFSLPNKELLSNTLSKTDGQILTNLSPTDEMSLFNYNGVEIQYRNRISPITGRATGEVEIERIETPEALRGEGLAREALNEFIRLSDNQKIDLYLMVSPRDADTTVSGLISFYESVGFKNDGVFLQEMSRRAKKPPTTINFQGGINNADTVQNPLGRQSIEKAFENYPQVAELFNNDVKLYEEYLRTVSNQPLVHKGFRNKSGYVHKTPNHSFFSPDYNISEQWYGDETGVKTYIIPKGAFTNYKYEGGYKAWRQSEEDFINNSEEDLVILYTNDIGGYQDQFAIKKDIEVIEVGSEADLQMINEFLNGRDNPSTVRDRISGLNNMVKNLLSRFGIATRIVDRETIAKEIRDKFKDLHFSRVGNVIYEADPVKYKDVISFAEKLGFSVSETSNKNYSAYLDNLTGVIYVNTDVEIGEDFEESMLKMYKASSVEELNSILTEMLPESIELLQEGEDIYFVPKTAEDLENYPELVNWVALSRSNSGTITEELIEKYKDKWDFDLLTYNSSVPFTPELLEKYEDKWYWWGLSRNESVPFTPELLEKYKDKWNWRSLSDSKTISFTPELIEKYEDKWDWNSLSSNSSIPFTPELIEKYKYRWVWRSLSSNNSIPFTPELIEKHKDMWFWWSLSENSSILFTPELLEKYKDEWNWSRLSESSSLPFTPEIIEKYKDKWDWDELSRNKSVPFTPELLEKHEDRWYWDVLSENTSFPFTPELIEKYEDWWNWRSLSSNSSTSFTPELIEKYKDRWFWWDLSENSSIPFTPELIEKHKDMWAWGELSRNKSVPITPELIEKHEDRWDFNSLSVNEAIPFTPELIEKYKDRWYWSVFARNEAIPFTPELLEKYKDRWRFWDLSSNSSVPFTPELLEKYKDEWRWGEFLKEGRFIKEYTEIFLSKEKGVQRFYKISEVGLPEGSVRHYFPAYTSNTIEKIMAFWNEKWRRGQTTVESAASEGDLVNSNLLENYNNGGVVVFSEEANYLFYSPEDNYSVSKSTERDKGLTTLKYATRSEVITDPKEINKTVQNLDLRKMAHDEWLIELHPANIEYVKINRDTLPQEAIDLNTNWGIEVRLYNENGEITQTLPKKVTNNKFFSRINNKVNGYYNHVTQEATVVEDAPLSTTIHEAFSHPFLISAKNTNPTLYQNLLQEAKKQTDIVKFVDGTYSDVSQEERNDEYITHAIDMYVNNELDSIKDKGLIEAIKEFFKHISDTLKEILNIETTVSELSPKMTLKDLAQYVIYGDGQIDLKVPASEEPWIANAKESQEVNSQTYEQLLSLPTVTEEEAAEMLKHIYSSKMFNWQDKPLDC